MTTDNVVPLGGQIDERPHYSETAEAHPVAEFWLKHLHEWTGKAGQPCLREYTFLVRVAGRAANSISKYWHPGCNVTVAGQLAQRSYPPDNGRAGEAETYILAERLSYLSPRRVYEAIGASR